MRCHNDNGDSCDDVVIMVMMTMVITVRTVITMMFDDNGVNDGDDNQVFYLAPVPSCAPTDDDVDSDWAD